MSSIEEQRKLHEKEIDTCLDLHNCASARDCTGTVTLKGINNYTGTKKVNFKIIPVVYADYEEEFDIDVKDTVYSKGGAIPEVHIFWKDNELKAGTDYTLKYANNKKVTDEFVSKWPTVTITFKGNYKGTVRRDFFIDPKPLDLVTITAKDRCIPRKQMPGRAHLY